MAISLQVPGILPLSDDLRPVELQGRTCQNTEHPTPSTEKSSIWVCMHSEEIRRKKERDRVLPCCLFFCSRTIVSALAGPLITAHGR
jgi:hypothetical protein